MGSVVGSIQKEVRNTERGAERKVVEEGGRTVINKSLKCMTLNAQSLRYKMEECSKYAEDYKSSLISVTETWGQEEIGDEVFNIDKYNMYRNDRKGRKGSGTILYIKKNLGQRRCWPMTKHANREDYDSSVWCWISPSKGTKILVGSIYRSTSSTVENDRQLLEMIEKANEIAGDNRLLIMGDFNVPKIDWINNDVQTGATVTEKNFFETIMDNFLHQHVTVHTRFRGTERSILDLIFTKEEDDVKNIEVLPPIGGSDHGVVMGDFICEWKSRSEQKKRKVYFRGAYDVYETMLNQKNWGSTFAGRTLSENWGIYRGIEKKLSDKNIPLVSPRDYIAPWMNKKVMRQWKSKHRAWRKVTTSNSDRSWNIYKEERNKLRKIIRKEKRLYEKKIAGDARHNKRAFYKYVNSKLTVRPEITQVKKEDGLYAETDKEIGDTIGKYFNSVHPPYFRGKLPDMQTVTHNKIGELSISPKLVEERLAKLNIHKASGPDGIHPHVLQKTAKAMSIPLAKLFQQSLDTGEVPEDWRTANITPIHKKGDRSEPSNYRPVSLTSQVCKILETFIRDKIVEHLTVNNLLSEAQHGFRKGRSCLTNILQTLELWTKILDEGNCIDVAYLDFRKAFDLVSHELLIYKMSKYGIEGQILKWVKNWLHERTQKVVIRGTASDSFKVTSGVPQGSVLGPILFLIFINDLPTQVISPISLFADDSKVFTRIVTKSEGLKVTDPKGNEVLQEDLKRIQDWAKKWKMEFNVDKCKIMHIGGKNPKYEYNMNGTKLTETKEEKDLGVIIDCRLEFDRHIKNIVARANRTLGMIRISFECMDKSMFLNLYKGLVRPLLEYCVQAWSPYKRKYIDLIEGVQRRATRLVPEFRRIFYDKKLKLWRRMTYEERLAELKLPKLEDRRIRGDMIETYKLITGKEDVNANNFFSMATVRSARNNTHEMKIRKKHSRLEVRRNYFSQRVSQKWNNLSPEEVGAKKTSEFKEKYDAREAERAKVRERETYVWV